MGTDVSLVAERRADARAFERAARRVERVFAREERRFSRFRTDTELARVNARAGRRTSLSAPFARVVALALAAARTTGGLFDPTVLPTLRALGYDRDFDDIIAGARAALAPSSPSGRWGEVELDADSIRLPAGVEIDLGGIAKGWTSDRAAEAAVAEGLRWAIVNAGGDLRIAGDVPTGGIEVGVEDPGSFADELARLRLDGGALATSCITKRAWGPGLHHLIDPRTDSPVVGDVLQATVWAPTCAQAEVLAKVAVMRGESALERMHALVVLADGTVVTTIAARERSGAAA
jgi:thiamine biosynthesis lipoprotein